MLRNTPMAAVLLTSLAVLSQAEVQLDRDRCVLVNGKRFFAVGIYNAFQLSDLPMVAEAGFNLVHSYAWEGERDYDGMKWLDAAHKNGLKALIGLYRPDVEQMDFRRSIERIRRYRDHPALLAWHVMDEPNWDRVDKECLGIPIDGKPGKEYMPAAYRLLKRYDPHHPVTTVTVNHHQMAQFMPSVDIMQTDYYCIPPFPQSSYFGTGFLGIKLWVQRSREASGGSKPFWFVCEAWDYGVDKAKDEPALKIPVEWQRFPTPRELRTMTYTAIAAGARGILYYALHLLTDEAGTRGGDRKKYWNWLASVTRELHQLQPVLTADTPEMLQDSDHVVSLVKSDGKDLYVIAANYERQPTKTVIYVPGIRQGKAEVVFGEGTAEVRGGELACKLEAIESRVYRLRREHISSRFGE